VIDGSPNQPWRKRVGRGLSENFKWYDGLTLLLGAVLGFAGNALFNGDVATSSSLLILGILTFCAVTSISRFRSEAEAKAIATLEEIHSENIEDFQELHRELQDKLKKHLNQVHAAVSFVPDPSGTDDAVTNSKPGYDVATAAVHRARTRIFVVGDYCPPSGEGAALDEPPEHRSEYLQAIEKMLIERLEANPASATPLEYRRFIQRPINVYNEIKRREETGHPGVALRSSDMIGDRQVFEHCRRVLDIAVRAETQRSDRIRVQIKVIPFLPNCPSVLLVDNRDVQFTIPTRIDRPGDSYARQGLLGVLMLEDKAGGSEICYPFEELFTKLGQFSATVIKIDTTIPAMTDPLKPFPLQPPA
jgi:hypothetical protein